MDLHRVLTWSSTNQVRALGQARRWFGSSLSRRAAAAAANAEVQTEADGEFERHEMDQHHHINDQIKKGRNESLRQTIKQKIALHDLSHPPLFSHPILFPSSSFTSPTNPIPTSRDLSPDFQHLSDQLARRPHPLVDRYQRNHTYLRISLTERCNLRCTYCMPAAGVPLSPPSHLLTTSEILHLSSLFVSQGVTKIRLTGGEPTLRKDLLDVFDGLNSLKGRGGKGLKEICMTSNGLVLGLRDGKRLQELVDRGLTGLNLSLDTLVEEKFEKITRRRGHGAVLASLYKALSLVSPSTSTSASGSSGLRSVKLNVVLTRDVNLEEMLDFVRLTRDSRLSVRFIEFMPFSGNEWDKQKMVPYNEALGILKQEFGDGLISVSDGDGVGDGTSKQWKVRGWAGEIGFISSMSDHFCGTCNRLRITADGNLKVCLFDNAEVSLRDILRSSNIESAALREDALLNVISLAVGNKKAKHAGMDLLKEMKNRSMVMIGDGVGLRRSTRRGGLVPLHLLAHPAAGAGGIRLVRSLSALPCAGVASGAKRCFSSTTMLTNKANTAVDDARGTPTASNTTTVKSASNFTHLDDAGRASMVSISHKAHTTRRATAIGRIFLPPSVFSLLSPTHTPSSGERLKKGDVLGTARLAGIMAAKQTSSLIPLCHPVGLTDVKVTFRLKDKKEGGGWCHVRAVAECNGQTGVEMEALTAASVSLLTVWDMTKALGGKEMCIEGVMVVHKEGGKSGDWRREGWEDDVDWDL